MKSQNKEICWNLINSLLAGGLVLVGSLAASKEISGEALIAAIIAFATAFLIQFKNYWDSEKQEYLNTSNKLFKFI